jgi:hypothetical protein
MKENLTAGALTNLSEFLFRLGYRYEDIPFIARNGPNMSINEFRSEVANLEEIIMVHDASISLKERSLSEIGEKGSPTKVELNENVFVTPMGSASIFPYRRGYSDLIWEADEKAPEGQLRRSVFDWIVEIVSKEWNLKNIVDMDNISEKEVEIGVFDGKAVRDSAYVFNKNELKAKKIPGRRR